MIPMFSNIPTTLIVRNQDVDLPSFSTRTANMTERFRQRRPKQSESPVGRLGAAALPLKRWPAFSFSSQNWFFMRHERAERGAVWRYPLTNKDSPMTTRNRHVKVSLGYAAIGACALVRIATLF